MNPILLKDGDIRYRSQSKSFDFELPERHLMVWVNFSEEQVIYVVECSAKKVEHLFSKIVADIQKWGAPVFVKYLLSAPDSAAIEAHFAQIKITPAGKQIRNSSFKGSFSFEAKSLRVEKKIRLMIVDDSKTIRDLLTRIFSADPEFEIIATVDHPHKAQKLIPQLKPDVITLDIHMPEMDGVELLRSYIRSHPIPTVMISSITLEEGPLVLNALELGAIDYIQKPSFNEISHVAPMMIEKVKAASRSKVKTGASRSIQRMASAGGEFDSSSLVLVGSSTGGTEALKQMFLSMPEKIPPMLVVQHIPAVFSKAFADRMNQLCPFEVKEASDGDQVLPNQVLVAPGGFQMELVHSNSGGFSVKVSDAPPMNRHKPSVDFLFKSAVRFTEKVNMVAAILTGMGADGAVGMKALRDKGVKTIAQDEATCVVFGMPKEAIRLGGAENILPLDEIGKKIVQLSVRTRSKAS